MPPLSSVMITPLATLALAAVAVATVGAGFGGSALMGGGIAGLAVLTLFSERWQRRTPASHADAGMQDAVASVESTSIIR